MTATISLASVLSSAHPVLATWDAAAGWLAVGAVIGLAAFGIGALGVWLARDGRWFSPLLLCVAAASVGFVALMILLIGVGAVECAPDQYECPL